MKNETALQTILKSRLFEARVRHPSFSLRAYSLKAGVSPSMMSQLIQGKRQPSPAMAFKLSERLNLDPVERAQVLGSQLTRTKTSAPSEDFVKLTQDQYQLVSDWRAFAILNLTKAVDFSSSPKWIAERLDITKVEAEETIERLKRLEMVTDDGKTLKRKESRFRTSEDVLNTSLQKSHSLTMDLAQKALETVAVDDRDYSWITIPLDIKKMKDAKSIIRKFQSELMDSMSENSEPTEVYRLAVQFFPLTKLRKKRGNK